MTPRTLLPAVPSDCDQATLSALSARLHTLDYTPAGLDALLGPAAEALVRNDPAAVAWALGSRPEPLARLVEVFVLGRPVARTALGAALGSDLLARLVSSGLLRGVPSTTGDPAAEAALESVLSLVPFAAEQDDDAARTRTLLLLSDFGTLVHEGPLDDEFVLGLGGAGRTLARITPRETVDRALDLGTGCGIQALLLAEHCAHVVATDLSERALDIARLNADLNGIDNVEFRLGSLFAPVAGEIFDLVVSNPPFVITPQGSTPGLTYRDGGLAGDAIMRTLFAQAPDHLAPEGHAAFLGNWEYGTERPAGPAEFPRSPDTSVLVIERQRQDVYEYAETWVRDGGVVRASDRWYSDVQAWLDDFAARGVDDIGFGYVRMHKGTGPTRRNADGAVGVDGGVASAACFVVERIDEPVAATPAGLASFLTTSVGLHAWLVEVDDVELDATAFVRAPDVTEARHFMPGEESPRSITLSAGVGFARTFAADAALAGFLGVADGTLTLAQVSSALAALLEVDEADLAEQLRAQVRTLVAASVVFPAG